MIFLQKKLIDFEKEIKYFNREKNYLEKILIFFKEDNGLFILVMLVLDFFYLFITLEETKVFSQNLSLTEILFSGFKQIFYVFLTNVLYLLISYFLVNSSYTKKLIEKFERTSKPYEYYMNILDYFEEYFYPEEYKEEFRKNFKKYYEKDKEKFEDWIYYKQVTIKKLYAKLLNNKALQKEIFEEILKKNTFKIAKENEVKIINEIKEENKKRKLEIQTNKIKKEMDEYFGRNFEENFGENFGENSEKKVID
jgi:hypothetical protein